jgi:hypothetical protein
MTSSLGTCVASARQPRPSQTSCPWSARWCARAPARPRPSPQRSPRARVRRGAPLRVPKAARVLNAPRRAPQAHGESPPAAGAARGAQLVVLDRKADLVSPMVSHGPSRAGGPGGAGEDGAAVRDKATLFEHRARAVEAQALAGRCSADKALGCAEELLYARQPLPRVLRLFALIAQLSGGLRHHAHYLREISHVYGLVSTARCAPPAPLAPANTPARAHAPRPARDSFELLPTLGALERASVLPAKDDAGAGVAGAVGRRMICRARAPPRVPTAAPPLAAGSGAKGVLRAGCPA